jgi:hypothetical protein
MGFIGFNKVFEGKMIDPEESVVGATPLDFLRAVYMNVKLPLNTRLKAAIEAAPFVHPKLAVAVTFDGGDFAERLGRAIERSSLVRSPKVIEAKPVAPVINHRLTPLVRRA